MSATSTCVVICYYVGQPRKNLLRLLDQMRRVPAGAPFDVVVVVNGGDARPLALPGRYKALNITVVNRINRGYNIEAWDVGWRSKPYQYYLFLQPECFLKRRNWVADFEFRMARDEGVGLLGELYCWEQKTWPFIRESTDRDLGRSVWPAEPTHPIDTIRLLLEAKGFPLTPLGTHLASIILYTSQRVMEEVGGFPLIGPSYREAVAAEVGFSRLVEAKGYRLSRIRDRDFSVIGHRQYTRLYDLKNNLRGRVRRALRFVGLR